MRNASSKVNLQVAKLYNRWKLPANDLLPNQAPTDVATSPYLFYTSHNVVSDYIKHPRLLVTKLLTERWCEMREYYTVFLDSETIPTRAMTAGVVHHSRLENARHRPIDTTGLRRVLNNWARRKNAQIPLVVGRPGESEMAFKWGSNISKIFLLLTTGSAREVLVHGFINLDSKRFVRSSEPDSILVSGVIDQLEIKNPSGSHGSPPFDIMHHYLEHHHWANPVVDLTKFLNEYKSLSPNLDATLIVTDIKTRSFNRVPAQRLVLDAARTQTFYYHQFFDTLTQDPCETYESMLENARHRGLDVDAPLSFVTIIELVAAWGNLLAADLIHFAEGLPLGFAPYDDYYKTKCTPHDFGSFIERYEWLSFVKEVECLHPICANLEFLQMEWIRPPTLRWLAARSAQFYSCCLPFIGDETTVEYHNAVSEQIFETHKHHFDRSTLQRALRHACEFWNGERPPNYSQSTDMCKQCGFKAKCRKPHNQTPEEEGLRQVGLMIHQYLDA